MIEPPLLFRFTRLPLFFFAAWRTDQFHQISPLSFLTTSLRISLSANQEMPKSLFLPFLPQAGKSPNLRLFDYETQLLSSRHYLRFFFFFLLEDNYLL